MKGVAPTVHGKWVNYCPNHFVQWWGYNCSICNKWINPAPSEHIPNYCPSCGAKMNKVE